MMSKMSELDLVLQEFHEAANALNRAADSLRDFYDKPADKAPTKGKAQPEPPKPEPLTLEKVRGVLAEKSRNGFTAEVRTLLEKHGGSKLSEISPDNYPALLKDAEGLK